MAFLRKYITKKVVKRWEMAAAIAILISLLLFLSTVFFHFDDKAHHVLAIVESIIVGVFLIEVGVNLIHTDDKIGYLKKNWFYILTILPLAAVFRMLRLGKTVQLAHLAKVFEGLRFFEAEGQAIKLLAFLTPARLMMARNSSFMAYHLYHTNFDSLPVNHKLVMINKYVNPKVNKNISKGILDGVKYYYSKNDKAHVVFKNKQWIDAFKVEQSSTCRKTFFPIDVNNYLTNLSNNKKNLVITDEELINHNHHVFGGSEINGSIVCSSKYLDKKTEYNHIPYDKFMQLRGFIIGYNSIANNKDPCYMMHQRCAHKKMNLKTLDMHSFLLYVNGKIPLCNNHK